MLKKNKTSKLGALSLGSRLKHKQKKTAQRKVLLATIAGAGAAVAAAVGLGAKGRDPR